MMTVRYLFLTLFLSFSAVNTILLPSVPAISWKCQTCTFRNVGATQACELCTAIKPAAPAVDEEDAADNIAMVAAATGVSVPVAAPTPHQAWACWKCTAVNWPDATICEVCDTARPRIAPRSTIDDAALAARLQAEEDAKIKRDEAARRAQRAREQQASEALIKRMEEEAASKALIAKIQAEEKARKDSDARSHAAALALAEQYKAEEERERRHEQEADAALARALAAAEAARIAAEEAARIALIAQLTIEDNDTAALIAQKEADLLLAMQFQAEEVANAEQLRQAAARAAAELGQRRRTVGEVAEPAVLTVPPAPLPPVTPCPEPPLLPNTTGTCFMNAMLHCLFSSSRMIDPIQRLGTSSTLTTTLNKVLAAYRSKRVPEGLLLALHQELLNLLPVDHARVGGDSAFTYQVLADELQRLTPTFNSCFVHLGLPDTTATPISLEMLIEYYAVYLKQLEYCGTRMIIKGKMLLPIDTSCSILVFNIARALPDHAVNTKPVNLPEVLTINGVKFRLTACTCHIPDHAFAQKRTERGWFECDDNRHVTSIPTETVTTNNTQAYLVVYERI